MKKKLLFFAGLVRYLKKWLQPGSGKFDVTFRQKMSVLFHGFMPDQAVFYDFKKYDRKDFLTDWEMYTKAIKINAGYTELLNNKLVFTDYMRAFVKMAETPGYFMRGKVVPLEAGGERTPQNPIDFLDRHLKDNSSYMIKKFDAGSGEGIFKVGKYNGSYYLNEKEISEADLNKKLSKLNNYMISETVEQAEYSKKIFPRTANTVKFITMIDPDTQDAFLAACFHRFGSERSVPVDNVGKGSCLARIDVDTGVMSPVYLVRDRKLTWITHHPDTNMPIEGERVSHFDEIKAKILSVHNKVKYIKYIAWDVVVQENGEFILLEGNANTDMAGVQPFEPILANPRARRFYQYHNVVKR
ncbi:MAG: hypothetical protein IJF80_06570 [Clostridia bacterium]|nr:hypothetical protein [Clostridia bacterium]